MIGKSYDFQYIYGVEAYMEYNTRKIHPSYKTDAKTDIHDILVYITTYLHRTYSNTTRHDGLINISINGNVKCISIKKRGYKHHYRDYKNKLYYKENTVESVNVLLDNSSIRVIYRKEEVTHSVKMTIPESIDYIGLDNTNFLIRDLIDRKSK